MLIEFCHLCGEEYSTKMKNQKYCSFVCRETATKQKIEDRARMNRNRKRMKNPRKCKGGCGTIISVYNDYGFCNICQTDVKKVEEALKEIRLFFDYEKIQDI